MQKKSLVLRVCDWFMKYSIYTLLFLLPIFFLPWTSDVLDFNKQALLVLLVFVSIFALMINILVSGKFGINKSYMHIVAGLLFLAYLASTIFSLYRYGSFWGSPQQINESMLTVLCLLLFYFLVSNVFSKKEILTSVVILCSSAVIAELAGVFQILKLFFIPFDFTKSANFNLTGSAGSLGILTAALLPLAILLLISVKKWWRFLFVLQIVVSFLALILIGYNIIWWVAVAGTASILILGMIKRNFFDVRWMSLPMFFFAVSLFFALFNPQLSWLPSRTNEILLSQKSSLDIAIQGIKAQPVLGSGPGTFAYDFLKFKDANFSATSLWNTTFHSPASRVFDNLTTTGILGFLIFLTFMAFPIFYGIKFVILQKQSRDDMEKSGNQIYSVLIFGLCVGSIAQTAGYFIYNPNITLDFVYFFMAAALIGLVSGKKKEYSLKPSSWLTLALTFIFTIIFIFGAGLLVLDAQRYSAEVSYDRGLAAYQSGDKANGLKNLESAASLNSQSDIYLRQLSQAYLLSLQDEMQSIKSAPTDQEKAKIQMFISNSINAGKIAADLNPQDADNWSSRGYIYQNMIGISNDALTWAISSYDTALKLDPNNPYLFFQEGNAYLVSALNASNAQLISVDQKNQLLSQAQQKLEKSVALKPDYSDALYSLGLVYDALGQNSEAIDAFTKLQKLNPQNTDLQKILDNLNAGVSVTKPAVPPAK